MILPYFSTEKNLSDAYHEVKRIKPNRFLKAVSFCISTSVGGCESISEVGCQQSFDYRLVLHFQGFEGDIGWHEIEIVEKLPTFEKPLTYNFLWLPRFFFLFSFSYVETVNAC